MRVIFASEAWEDYLYWQVADAQMLKRINTLIHEAKRDPFVGSGKPEPLRANWSGYWSRRITDEHRMVYRVAGDDLLIVQLRYHY